MYDNSDFGANFNQDGAVPTMLDHAIDYAREHGWPVFPCDPATKKPLTEHGFHDATCDPEQISAWWHRWPDAMIGIPTGVKTGVVVLDVDVDPAKGIDGREALKEHDMPSTMAVQTPRGGIHYYFRYPEGSDIRNSAGQLGVGLDVRGEGGYVIVPPSVNANGGQYRWFKSEAVEPTPDWFVERTRKKDPTKQDFYTNGQKPSSDRIQAYGDVALARICDDIAFASEGTRNETLFKGAARMADLVAGGYSAWSRVRNHLWDAALAAGLPTIEIDKSLESAFGRAEPRGPTGEPNRSFKLESRTEQPWAPYGEKKEEPKEEIEPFKTIRASSFEGKPIPEVEFLDARKLFPLGHASLLTGATKVGKTYIALQSSVACVTKTKWLNETIRSGPVIFYSAEETIDVLHMRLAKICEAEMLSLSDLSNLHLIDLSKIVNAALIRGDNRTESITETDLYKQLDLTMGQHKPVMLWVDNKGLAVTGNENSRSMAAAGARAFQVLAHRHHCAVGMLMHPSNTGMANETGASGSTANFAGYRSVIHMTKPKEEVDKSVRVLENDLANYAEGGVIVNLKWDFGRYICTDKPKRADDAIGRHDKAERVFLKLLRWHVDLRLEVSPNKMSSGYAPVIFEAHKDHEGLNRKWFKMAMDNLLQRRIIEVAERGPPSGRVKFLREVQL